MLYANYFMGQEDPLEKETTTYSNVLFFFFTPVLLPGHGQKSLVGHSPWGHKESGTTEHTHTNYLNFKIKNKFLISQI